MPQSTSSGATSQQSNPNSRRGSQVHVPRFALAGTNRKTGTCNIARRPSAPSSAASLRPQQPGISTLLSKELCAPLRVSHQPSAFTTADWRKAAKIIARNPDVSTTGIWAPLYQAILPFGLGDACEGQLARCTDRDKVRVWPSSRSPPGGWPRPLTYTALSMLDGTTYYNPLTNCVKWDSTIQAKGDELWNYRVPWRSVAKFFIKLNVRLNPCEPRLTTIYARQEDGLIVSDVNGDINFSLPFWRPERVLLNVGENIAYIPLPVLDPGAARRALANPVTPNVPDIPIG